jgi:hypothetical protein
MGMPVRVIHEAAAEDTIPAPPTGKTLARDLQRALARADCYRGPISGTWTPASKEAMGSFLVAVNAQLPIDDPDPTLLALVSSNAAATCSSVRPITTGALSPAALPDAEKTEARRPDTSATASQPARESEPRASIDDRPMIERAWAPAEMLVPPKDTPPPQPATASSEPAITISTAEPVAKHDVSTSPPYAPATAAPPVPLPPVVHFEGNKLEAEPDPKAAQIEAETSAAAAQSPAQVSGVEAKGARKHSKSRRKSDYDDMSTSISKGFDNIQRSISSFFD